ncbi:MAG: hypothetical protein ACTSU5_00630 [Promethearchaeota archaeon]
MPSKRKKTCPYCGREYVNIKNHLSCTKRPAGAPPPWEALEAAKSGKTGSKKKKSAGKKGAAKKKIAAKKPAKKRAGKKPVKKKAKAPRKKKKKAPPKKPPAKSRKKASTKKVSNARTRRRALESSVLQLIEQEEPINIVELKDKMAEDGGKVASGDEIDDALRALFLREDISRTRVLEKGAWVYEFTINNDGKASESGKKKWETLGNCPCFVCPSLDKCNIGQNRHNPHYCEHLTEWVFCQLRKVPYKHRFKAITDNVK